MSTSNSSVSNKRDLYGRAELFRLVRPRSIAIIGASPTPGSFGYRTVQNTQLGFDGKVYPVNPKYPSILGMPCFPDIDALPEVPDCVVLTIPKEAVPGQIERCAAIGVGGAVIFSSGFSEGADAAGTALQERITAAARGSQLRVLGPNCIGIVNLVDRVGITFQPGLSGLPIARGSIGLVAQSGGLGSVIAQGMQRGIGFSYNFSSGNSCDVDISDLVNFLIEDEETTAIACILEGVRDGRRLVEVARRASLAGKPLIVHKMGNNDLSRKTALSHTGTLAGSVAAYRAAFERGNAIVVEDFEAILETASFFSKSAAPGAPGIGVMSASGGAAVMAADKADLVDVLLPPLAQATADKLQKLIPNFGSTANPCDITAASVHDKALYGKAIETFADDPSFAAVVVPMMTAHAPSTVDRAKYLSELSATLGKPVCIVWLNEWYQGPGSEVYDGSPHLSMFRSMRRCMETLKSWLVYHERRDRMLSSAPSRVSDPGSRAAAGKILAERGSDNALTERISKAVLACYGVRTTRETLARSAEDAIAAAKAIGYPVVIKAESSAIPHKTEAGVVHLNLRSDEEVRAAFDDIHEKVKRLPQAPSFDGVLVQEMVKIDAEVLVGTHRDPQFGPIVVCGLGGIFVELLRDSVSALAPVTQPQAIAMLESLKGYPLLKGFRGSRAINITAMGEAIARISELAMDNVETISEMDVNPIVGSANDVVAVDALIITGPH